MNVRIISTILIILCFGFIGFYFLKRNTDGPHRQNENDSLSRNLAASNLLSKPTSEISNNVSPNVLQSTNFAGEFERTDKNLTAEQRLKQVAQRSGISMSTLTQQVLMQLSNELHNTAEQVNPSVEFYGRVLDESGTPLEGATVEFGCVIYPEKYFRTNSQTDANGNFSLANVRAAALNVQVRKEGYSEISEKNTNRFVYYSPSGTAPLQPDVLRPVIFLLRSNISNQ